MRLRVLQNIPGMRTELASQNPDRDLITQGGTTTDMSLIPRFALAPPVNPQPHIAPARPSQIDLDVGGSWTPVEKD